MLAGKGDMIERFRNSPSRRLVRAGTGDAAYWAYLPNPLPPVVPLDPAIARGLSEASYALGELAAFGRNMPNPHLLIGPFMRREAVLSSRIEGTQASIAELYAYEARQLPIPGMEWPSAEADVREVANYVVAMEYGLHRMVEFPVSLRLIRELHERLMRGVRGERATPGEFRTSQNWIGRPGCTLSQADYVPPPPPEMHGALDAFEKYLHAADPDNVPLARLAYIHYQFEAIHPFLDGNGRIGRLLVALLLVNWGLLPAPLLYLSDYFESHRDDYYRLLAGVSERGAWGDWLRFFLAGITSQAQDASRRAGQLQDLSTDWRARPVAGRASALVARLADYLFSSPFITIAQAQRTLGVTYHSARRAVDRLLAAGILAQSGDATYDKTYVAQEILRIIAEPRRE
jgi:Fic family protein